MNINTKGKGYLTADICSDKSVALIGDSFFKVSWTERKFPLFIFDNYIYNNSIPIGAATTSIELTNGNIISHLNKGPLLPVGRKSFLYIS